MSSDDRLTRGHHEDTARETLLRRPLGELREELLDRLDEPIDLGRVQRLHLQLGDGVRYEEAKAAVATNPNAYGDCRQDLVFIGVGMNEEAIRKALDDCLLKTKDEFAQFKQQWAQAQRGYTEVL